MKKLLEQIVKENDIKNIPEEDYGELAKEIRIKLVRSISKTGGHLASNLGVVELTMALHLVLDFPKDKLVWDVGHQSYVHKLLTGRGNWFDTLRQMDGLSGFPKIHENPSDTFDTGHSSTSISAALGLAKARDLQGTDEKVFAVIGDGALTGGMAYEALNNAAALHSNMVIVLNDNKMSIAPNVGGMSNYLGKIRANRKYRNLKANVETTLDKLPNVGQPIVKRIKRAKNSLKQLFIPGMLFEDMGLIYIGPVDGHNIYELKTAFETASSVPDQPVLVHVLTRKGRGYKPAQKNPAMFHGVGPFDIRSGKPYEESGCTYTDIFGKWLCDKAEKMPELVSVCAAMPDGTGLNEFTKKYPQRFFDVGIAEEHAVTFAAGLAAGGMRPVVSIYSTFLQRAFDQMIHDVCLCSMPVIFAIDRSGIVGRDGETHQGIFDLSYLGMMPHMTVVSPMDKTDMELALNYATEHEIGPIAVRYPRGGAFEYKDRKKEITPYKTGKAEVLVNGREIAILAVGSMVEKALEVQEILASEGLHPTIVNMRFVKPFDEELVWKLARNNHLIVTMEDNVYSGGFSERIQAFLQEKRMIRTKSLPVCFPDTFIEQGSREELFAKYHMDAESVVKRIKELL